MTFESALGVRKAVKAGVTVVAEGREVPLKVKPSTLDQELKRADTGALAKIWNKQRKEVPDSLSL